MRHIATAALMLNFGVASVYAQPNPVNMAFSGDGGASAINFNLSNTKNGEQHLAGNSTLGPFTFRLVRATATSSQPSSTCSGVFFPRVAGAGIFRFQDGSLLKVSFQQGGDCIDFVHMMAHCTLIFEIAGGTGRFQNASGDLTLIETALLVLDAAGAPVFFTETGQITGTISGVAMEDGPQNVQR